jgi:crotonobetainyl-CoA:carnitine CoA-transferase CaiB-like acyl-CoA transferase
MSREYSCEALAEKRPGIIYSNINAFGQNGPWATRPGWEQVSQAVTGLQLEEALQPVAPIDPETAKLPGGPLYMTLHTAEKGTPRVVPCAFSDYVTGYLSAFAIMTALYRRAIQGGTYSISTSLAQVSMALHRMGRTGYDEALACPDVISVDFINKLSLEEYGTLGHIMYLGHVVHMTETPPRYELPTVPRGSSKPVWLA